MQALKARRVQGSTASAVEPAGERVVKTGEPLGAQLQSYFDGLTAGPVPDRLLRLAEELEAALERGELRCGGRARPR